MKKIFILVFLLAFAACAGYGILTSKPIQPSHSTSSPLVTDAKPSYWETLGPVVAIKEQFYPYLHFREAMDKHLSSIPTYVSIGAIPKTMQQAIVATEDKRFYEHGAIDPIGIVRALAVNAYSGETVEGGSTISQQVVKNVFLTQDRTMTRKVQEVILAFFLEHYYSKDDILEIYLNTAYFGANATGLSAACQTYYGIKPERLSLSEASMLAGLVQAPTYLNPLENYDGARKRQQIVLQLMAAQGYITDTDAKTAYNTKLRLQQ